MMEKINVQLYGTSDKPLEADTIYCDRAEECSFYKSGKCLNCRALFAPKCKFGHVDTIKGYSKRAAKFYDFKRKYETDPVYNKLDYPESIVGLLGDTIYINTAYVDVRELRETDPVYRGTDGYYVTHPGFGNCKLFILKDKLTNNLMKRMFSFSPTSLSGGTIKEWKEKRVPKILEGLKKHVSDVYDRFVAEYPEYKYEPDYVGKTAYVDSLDIWTKFRHNGMTWTKEEEYVVSEEANLGTKSPWFWNDATTGTMRIKITPKMKIKVEDNDIVNERTRFEE